MIGLIRKELYTLVSLYRKNLILVLVMYTILGVALNNMVFPYMTIWMAGIYSFGCFSVDHMSGWERYARTLPVGDAKVVGSKFLATLILQMTATVYAVVIAAANCLLNQGKMMEELILITTFMSFSVISMGIMIPVAIKWGVEKARTGFSLGFGLIAGIVWFSVLSSDDPAGILGWMEKQSSVVVLVIIAVALYILGYLVGCRLYRKKEF